MNNFDIMFMLHFQPKMSYERKKFKKKEYLKLIYFEFFN